MGFMARRVVGRITGSGREVPGLPAAGWSDFVTVSDGSRLFVRIFSSDATTAAPSTPNPTVVTVVLVHGFNLSGESWFFQVDRLMQSPGVRVVVPDLRGHGRSTRPLEKRNLEKLNVEDTSRDLVDVLRQVVPGVDAGTSGPVMLVGHSMGVMTVLGALRLMPEAMLRRVGAVALINGAIDTFASAGITRVLGSLPARGLRAAWGKAPRGMEWVKDRADVLLKPVLAGFVYHGQLEEGVSADFDVVDFHAEEIGRTPMSTLLAFVDDLVEHDETDAAPYLKGIPGVVMVGKRDDVTPAEQTRKIAEAWPGGVELVEFPDSGHMLPVECPEAVNAKLAGLLARLQWGHPA
ncbi:MAG TPA: alpha/beta hydrolase [Candidatus Corynebacterium gallistercoris]|uniref:Alpha/beta hydrolase n=1 Tax=Candidatus Corynebacterium gallistercoris TaxID=2838530 RepID=A0A9D1URR7_9CORY|nr:alpha/beta hydrolase [Candidatus Corynebacterium gallistercoris]